MAAKNKKILILTGDAGLGHRSAAEAVRDALMEKYGPNCDVEINNPLNHPKVPAFIRDSQSDYDKIVKHLPDLYKVGYEVSNSNLPASLMEAGFIVVLYEAMREIISKATPDLVLTTYPLYQSAIRAVIQLTEANIPFMAVVTDLVTVHHVWFNTGVALCAVPTEAVWEKALEAGLTPEQLILTGIPVNPQIAALQHIEKAAVRAELGWGPDRTTILVAGSPRLPSLKNQLEALDQSEMDVQFALIAGGNDSLFDDLKATDWRHPAWIYNFVDFMPKLMRAADLILCKAGGLIVTESLASGLPLVLIHALPGQETGNVDYVVEHNAGVYCKQPKEILQIITAWLENERAGLQKVMANAAQLGKKEAAFKIADKVWDLAHSSQPVQVTQARKRETGRLRELLDQFNIPYL